MRRPHRGLRYGAAIPPTACGMAKTRPAQAIEYFATQGVPVKEFSEDSPLTVPLLPPGSACLTPADRSTRETCPRIPTSSAACWKSTLSSVRWPRTTGKGHRGRARREHRSCGRNWTGRPDVRPRCGTGRSPRSCTPQNRTPGPASPQWPSPRRPSLHAAHSARGTNRQPGQARRQPRPQERERLPPRPRLKAERGLHRKPMLMRYPTPVVRAVPYAALDPVLARPRGSRGRPGHRHSRHLGTGRAICAPKPALMVSRRRASIRRSGRRAGPGAEPDR